MFTYEILILSLVCFFHFDVNMILEKIFILCMASLVTRFKLFTLYINCNMHIFILRFIGIKVIKQTSNTFFIWKLCYSKNIFHFLLNPRIYYYVWLKILITTPKHLCNKLRLYFKCDEQKHVYYGSYITNHIRSVCTHLRALLFWQTWFINSS